MDNATSNTVVKMAWMPITGRKILFARSRDQELFYCVGGKREYRESDHEALVREVYEETGCLIDSTTIEHIKTFVGPGHGKAIGKTTVMPVFYAKWQGTPEPKNEVVELAWFTTADKCRTTVIGQTILDWFHAEDLID